MHDFVEKRDFHRMGVVCPARFRIEGAAEVRQGTVMNLSAAGLLIVSPQEIGPGTRLSVHIVPAQSITPPLSATANVVRSTPAGEGRFEIACSIERILSEVEAGPDFP
jgi:hypothetical protein